MSKTIVFFGNERLATGVTTEVETLQALIEKGYHIAAVVSNHEEARSRKKRSLEIEAVAKQHAIPFLLPHKPSDILEQLKGYQAIAGVLAAYGRIVPQTVIDIFPKGIINIHPSLLPLHRGPTPLESVILDGSTKTGVSVMALAKEMDAGPVYAQTEVELQGNESKQQLANKLLGIGKSMLIEVLPGILEGSIVALPQDDSRATYDQLLSKADGVLDWQKPAVQLEREVRAFLEWPRSRTTLTGKDVVITATKVVPSPGGNPGSVHVVDKNLVISCAERGLQIERLKPAGKPEMSAQAFLAGYKHLL